LTADKRTEITIETERILIIRRRRSVRAWCRECGCEAEMVSLGEAEARTEESEEEFRKFAPSHKCHFSENREGICLVCLERLRKWL
jgi:hypothetical protein